MSDDMKSSYELAMERLGMNDKGRPSLTDEQKEAIAEVENLAKSKIAEEEIMVKPALEEARAIGDYGKIELLEQEHLNKINKIKADAEAQKEKIRQQ